MERYVATGRRKNAVARVNMLPGDGKISINGKNLIDYFRRETLKMDIEQPLVLTDSFGKFDFKKVSSLSECDPDSPIAKTMSAKPLFFPRSAKIMKYVADSSGTVEQTLVVLVEHEGFHVV